MESSNAKTKCYKKYDWIRLGWKSLSLPLIGQVGNYWPRHCGFQC